MLIKKSWHSRDRERQLGRERDRGDGTRRVVGLFCCKRECISMINTEESNQKILLTSPPAMLVFQTCFCLAALLPRRVCRSRASLLLSLLMFLLVVWLLFLVVSVVLRVVWFISPILCTPAVVLLPTSKLPLPAPTACPCHGGCGACSRGMGRIRSYPACIGAPRASALWSRQRFGTTEASCLNSVAIR